jgi:DNA replication protein DnaC/transposase
METWLHAPPHPGQEEGEMRSVDRWTELQARARRGEATQQMARDLGIERKTGRRIVSQVRPVPDRRTVLRPAVVGPYRESIPRRGGEGDDNAHRLFQGLRDQGDPGGDAMVQLAVRPRRAERERRAAATPRWETAPGRQAQVDGGSPWAPRGDTRGRVPLWVMGRGYSRRRDGEFTRAQTLASLLACHHPAFEWFGGLPEALLADKPKPVVLKRDWAGRVMAWPPQLGDGAQDDGVTPRRCRPYRAQTKGTGAAGIKYGTRRCVQGQRLPAWDALNAMAQAWVGTVADQRLHGTTVRTPAEACQDEPLRAHLGRPPDGLQPSLVRTVARACLVLVETNRYVGPAAYGGQRVEVPWGPGETVQISHRGPLRATHRRGRGPHEGGGEPAPYAALRCPAPSPATRACAWRAGEAPSLPSRGGRWHGTRRGGARRGAMTTPQLARLQAHLGPLQLLTIQARLEPCRQEVRAPDGTSADGLERRRAEEVAAQSEKSVARRTVRARFPSRQTLESFDVSVQPSVDRQKRQELTTGRVIEPGDNGVFLGPPGTGTTHWALAGGLKAVQLGDRTLCTAATTRLATRTKADAENRREERLTQDTLPNRLIIDELGSIPLAQPGAPRCFQRISRRDERGAISRTANQSGGQWGEVVGHPLIATASLDRRRHHRVVINLKGESYRWREQHTAGWLKQPAASRAP